MGKFNLKSLVAGVAATAMAATAFAQVTTSWSNSAPITIPSSGNANPYPSTITVSGMPTGITNVAVRLNKMNHTWASDIDVLLVSPSGQSVIIMSDMGSSADLVNHTYTFIDGFPLLSTSTVLPAGTYAPSNSGTGDVFGAPGPGTVNQATPLLASLNGSNPNGVWSLYVVDDAGGDLGNINSGWDLIITSGAACPQPSAPVASAITTNSATITWTASVVGTFALEYGPAGYTPGTGTVVTTAGTSVNLTGLNPGTAYDVRVVQICGTGSSTIAGPTTFQTLVPGDDPCIAFPIGVNSSCVLTAGSTVGATPSAVSGPSCGSGPDDDVWYSFTAPASGSVAVTGTGGTATDLVAAIYSAPSCNGPFTQLGCDDDGGVGLMPGLRVNGLTPGQTYYIRWFRYSTGAGGTYNICVTEPQPCGGVASANNTVFCGVPASVTLSLAGAAAEATIQWQEEAPVGSGTWVNVGGSTTSTSTTVTVASVGPRRYRAQISNFSCVTATSNTVDINVDVVAAPTTGNLTICGPGSATLTASSATGAVRWYDAATGGNLVSSSTSFTTNVSATTTYYVAAFNPATGCESARVAATVTVLPLPTVSGSSSAAEVCDNGCVTLSATGATTVPTTSSFSNNNPVAIPDLSTVNSSLTVSGVSGGSLSATSVVSVTINLTHTWDNDLAISLISPSGTIIDLSSNNGGSGDNYTNTVFQTGAPSITGGTAPFTGTFSPEQPFSNLSGAINGTWTLRVTDAVNLDQGNLISWGITLANTTAGTPTFTWSGPGLSSTSGATVAACPSLGNTSAQVVTYTVTATDPNTGCSSSSNVQVQVNPLPVATCSKPAAPGYNNGADIVLGYGPQSVTLGDPASGGTPGYTYQWTGPNMSCTTCATPTVSPTVTSTYSVTVTDSKGCQASCSITVCVIDARCGNNNSKVLVCHIPPGNTGNPQSICIAPAAVGTHLSGHGDYLGQCGNSGCGSNKAGVTTEVTNGNSHGAFPNPFNALTNIRFTLGQSAQTKVEVFNANGARVAMLFEGEVEAGIEQEVRFNASEMPQGIYLYRIIAGEQTMEGKLVVTK